MNDTKRTEMTMTEAGVSRRGVLAALALAIGGAASGRLWAASEEAAAPRETGLASELAGRFHGLCPRGAELGGAGLRSVRRPLAQCHNGRRPRRRLDRREPARRLRRCRACLGQGLPAARGVRGALPRASRLGGGRPALPPRRPDVMVTVRAAFLLSGRGSALARVAVTVLLVVGVPAAAAEIVTVEEAVGRALARSPAVQAAVFGTSGAAARQRAARAAYT